MFNKWLYGNTLANSIASAGFNKWVETQAICIAKIGLNYKPVIIKGTVLCEFEVDKEFGEYIFTICHKDTFQPYSMDEYEEIILDKGNKIIEGTKEIKEIKEIVYLDGITNI